MLKREAMPASYGRQGTVTGKPIQRQGTFRSNVGTEADAQSTATVKTRASGTSKRRGKGKGKDVQIIAIKSYEDKINELKGTMAKMTKDFE